MSAGAKHKRGPTVLVTDSRDNNPAQRRRPGILQRQPTSTRLISVDNVLQYASEIPSAQRRGPPQRGPLPSGRTPAGRAPPDASRAQGRVVQQQRMPPRTSKFVEKLVLLPEADDVEEEKGEFALQDDEAGGPLRDEDRKQLRDRSVTGLKEKSYAERLSKASRAEKLSRVTAYCTAQAYKMRATADFVRAKHGAKTKLYDDCLYTVYHLPLLPGSEGYRIRSSPVLKSPGGKAVLDEEIERNERHEYREGFFGEEQYNVRGRREEDAPSPQREGVAEGMNEPASPHERPASHGNTSQRSNSPPALAAQLSSSLSTFAEMFIYSYGVVVFWNFTERQEKDILADLTFSSSLTSTHRPHSPGVSPTTTTVSEPLVVRPQDEEDFETEEFHFEYNPAIPRPRLFNDMITLRSGDHMIKLAMSHAIGQSTKLSFFEERMAETMAEAQHVPRSLAIKGDLGMDRKDVVRIVGKLFMSRVDVNLSSNILDVPNFFWESEPTLHPLYAAVREYLEIKSRIQVLNERCRVFLDLAEILTDSIADRKMSRITWIIIILIVISIIVTTSEVFLRFGLITAGKGKEAPTGSALAYLGRPSTGLLIGSGEL